MKPKSKLLPAMLLFSVLGLASCQRPQTTESTVAPTGAADSVVESDGAPASSTVPALPPYPEKLAPVTFSDVTATAGIRFRHHNGAYGKKYLPETTGSGCAFLDFDRDGWPDILLVNGMDFPDAPRKRRSVMALDRHNQD